MCKRYLYFILLIAVLVPATASEVSGPLSYVRYNENGYTITGADAPSLLLENEILSVDISNGTTIDTDHFYYAGTREGDRIDFLGNTYLMESVHDTAVLSTELWKGQDIKIKVHETIGLSDGYALKCTGISSIEEKATFVLISDKGILDTFSIKKNSVYNYSQACEIKNSVLFTFIADDPLYKNGNEEITLTDISIRKIMVLSDGQDLYEDYVINLEDIDWDGNEDIVVRLKPGHTFTLAPLSEIPLLNGYICLRTGVGYNHLLDRFDASVPLTSDDEYRIYSYKHNNAADLQAVLNDPSPDLIFSIAPYVKFNGMGKITTNTSAGTISSMSLRGKHEIYTYVHNDTLSLFVSKHDLNWYEGEDELDVIAYSPSGKVVGSITIPDDGRSAATRIAGDVQTGVLEVSGLQDGIYRIELISNDDVIIDELRSAQDKLVFDGKMFILSPGELYVASNKRISLRFMTLHDEGLQEINVKGSDRTYSTKLDTKNKWVNIRLPASASPYKIELPKGDIKIESDAFFAYSDEAFLSKEKFTIVPLYDTISKGQELKVDYFIVPIQKEQIVFYPYRNTTDHIYFDLSNYDNELNTWTSPGMFYFDVTGKRSWEFLKIDPGDDNVLSEDEIVYGSLQHYNNDIESPLDRTIAYLGEPYCVLEADNSSIVLSRIVLDKDIRVGSIEKIELGDGMTLEIHTLDPDTHKVGFSLYREGKALSDLEVRENGTTTYKEVIMGNEVPLVNIRCKEIVQGINGSSALLNINMISGHAIIIRDHDTFRDGSKVEITDINGDGLHDIKVTLEENSEILLENGRHTPILRGYLTLETENDDKILISKKDVPDEVDNLNIKVQYGTSLSFTEPMKEIPITIDNTTFNGLNIYYNKDVTNFSFLLKILKKLPNYEDNIEGYIHSIYDLRLYPDDPGTIYIEFQIEEQWFNNRGLGPEDVYIGYLKNGKWSYVAPSKIGEHEEHTIFSVNLKDPGTFCILGLPNTSKGYSKGPETISFILRSISEESNTEDMDQDTGTVEKLSSKAISSNVPIYIILFVSIVCITALLTYANRRNFAGDRTGKIRNSEKYRSLMKSNRRLCLTLFAVFMVLLIIEEIWRGSISPHLNINIILIFIVITCLIDLVGRRFWKQEGL
ncbi:S-layer protein domain-containing protein [Methanomethylovorans sp.]|uniref:S-layer protein domain-containing protein n=1 Tax=Methanomethylovorans sp. TaxID=2758717 RepID=UPI001BD4DB42